MDIQVFDGILETLAHSSSGLNDICKTNGISRETFYAWMREDKSLSDRYARAKELQMDFMADEIIKIADNDSADDTPFTGANHVNRAKVQIDARKWVMSKLAPKKYGDKVDVTSGGERIEHTVIQWGDKKVGI